MTSDKSKFTATSGISATYNSNGLSVVGTSAVNSYYKYNGNLPSNFILEIDVVSLTVGDGGVSTELLISHTSITNLSNATRFYSFKSDYSLDSYNDITKINPPFHLKAVVNNGTITYYNDTTQINQRSCGSTELGFKSYRNRGIVVKNMKVKPL